MTSHYHYPAITVDVAVFRLREHEFECRLEVLLIERGHEPFAECWALPGGFMDEDEDLDAAAARELFEETGVQVRLLMEVGVYGRPGRDPRGRTVSVVYFAWENPACRERAGDDAAKAAWFAIDALPKLAFDHLEMIEDAAAHFHSALTGYDPVIEIVPPEQHAALLNAITCHPVRSEA